jgi:hypothetical protein
MGIQTFQPEIGPRQLVRIITVDRKRRQVEARLKDGGLIYIPIWNVPTLFRWPKTGEQWIVRQDGGQWSLVESTDPSMQMRDGSIAGEGAISLESLREGEVRLTATQNEEGSGVWINNHQASRKITFDIGDGSTTVFTLNHNLDTDRATVSIWKVEDTEVDTPTTVITGPNQVELTFGIAPPDQSVRVVITG